MTQHDDRDRGIVILGMPRSGTTLLRRLFDAHPRIACGGETFLLRAAARFLQGDTVADGLDYGVLGGLSAAGFDREETLGRLRSLTFGFLEEIAARSGKPRWASKTAVDSFHLREIELLCGGHVRFVCVVRHALDTVCSLQELCEANETYIRELHRYVARHAAPREAFAHAWNDVTANLIDLVQRRPDEAVLVRYEDLTRSPESTLTELFSSLGEEYDESVLARAFEESRVSGLGDWKTYGTRGVEASSVARYRDLSEAAVSRLGAIVNPTLALAGYDPVPVSALPGPDEAMRRHEMLLTLKLARARSASASG